MINSYYKSMTKSSAIALMFSSLLLPTSVYGGYYNTINLPQTISINEYTNYKQEQRNIDIREFANSVFGKQVNFTDSQYIFYKNILKKKSKKLGIKIDDMF